MSSASLLRYPFGDRWAPKAGGTHQVAEGVYWLRMPLPFSLDHINLWLLRETDGWTVVDTGLDFPQARACWQSIFTELMQEQPVKRVIVTHLHPDHIGLAGWLTRHFSCELLMSRGEYLMSQLELGGSSTEAPESGIVFYRAAGYDEEALTRYRDNYGRIGSHISTLPTSFRRLQGGDILIIGEHTWNVVIGSGHSPEHVCLFCPELELLISGDQIIPRISSNVSVHSTEPGANPLREWLDSCHQLAANLPPQTLVLPAHQEPFYGLQERLHSMIDSWNNALDRLLAFLDRPRRAIDCFSAVYKRTLDKGSYWLAIGETLASLNYLIAAGLVERQRDEGGVDFYVATSSSASSAKDDVS